MVNFARKERNRENPKSGKNLFRARNLSAAEEIRVGHPKNSLSRLFFSLFFSFFLSFFLSFFRLKRDNACTREREMVEDAMDADKGAQTPLGAAGTASTTTTTTTTTTKRKIEVKKWNAVAVWSWSTSFDSCAICRNTLHEPSIEYQANSQQEGDDGLSIAVRFTSIDALVSLSFALSRKKARFRTRSCLIERFKNEISFCSEEN